MEYEILHNRSGQKAVMDAHDRADGYAWPRSNHSSQPFHRLQHRAGLTGKSRQYAGSVPAMKWMDHALHHHQHQSHYRTAINCPAPVAMHPEKHLGHHPDGNDPLVAASDCSSGQMAPADSGSEIYRYPDSASPPAYTATDGSGRFD